MFRNYELSIWIAYWFGFCDMQCRDELINGVLVSERDYVSLLCGRIRVSAANLKLACHTQTLKGTLEQRLGADGIVIFRSGQDYKVGIFEAKWPKIAKPNHKWDKLDSSSISHFTSQLQRQHYWCENIAIWELFINETNFGIPSPLDYYGSSCIWHSHAYDFSHTRQLVYKTWTTDMLKQALALYGMGLFSVIYDIVSCRAGKIIKKVDGDANLRVSSAYNDNLILDIPLPNTFNEDDALIASFMESNGLTGYIFIDLGMPYESK